MHRNRTAFCRQRWQSDGSASIAPRSVARYFSRLQDLRRTAGRHALPYVLARSSSLARQEPEADDTDAGSADLLSDIVVVLVAPKTPANIGAAARLCANFEVPRLVVVSPRCDPGCEEAVKVAAGGYGAQVLARCAVVDSLQDALEGTSSSVGFTRRSGSTRLTHRSIPDMLAAFPGALPVSLDIINSRDTHGGGRSAAAGPRLDQPPAALVFGREESGLTEAELRLCSHACSIPSGRRQPSLNLSHAVAVTLSQLFDIRSRAYEVDERPAEAGQAHAGSSGHGSAAAPAAIPPAVSASAPVFQPTGRAAARGMTPAAPSEVEALVQRCSAIAEAAGVSGAEQTSGANHGRKRLPVGHIRSLLSRAQVASFEARSLHGLAAAVLTALRASQPTTANVPTAMSSDALPPSSPQHGGCSAGSE